MSAKYGSIVEERRQPEEEDEEDEESDEQEQDNNLLIPDEELREDGTRRMPNERMSMNSFDYEITLKDRQEVSTVYILINEYTTKYFPSSSV